MRDRRTSRDSNGYAPSVLTTEPGECYVCWRTCETVRHEIMYGTANRELSKAAGVWIDVCPKCHRRIHAEPRAYLYLKEAAQRAFEAQRGHAEWMRIYGENYLPEEEWHEVRG